MGWRDRVKKSFGDSEYIGEGVENLKNQEKKRKEGLKTTFIYYPHNPQNPQNRQKEGEKPEPDQGDATSTVKEQSTPKPDPGDLSQPPAGSTPEYRKLWAEAWTLADWIDEPNGAPIEDRRARLPELMQLRARMAEIERQAVPTAGPDPEPSPAGTWHTWESGTSTRDRSPDTCPARCKQTGRCYGTTWFTGKPGPFPGPECDKDRCRWLNTKKDERADK
jgi:hypothetical protein